MNDSMNGLQRHFAATLFAVSLLTAGIAHGAGPAPKPALKAATDIPAHGPAVVLFDGKNLDAFEIHIHDTTPLSPTDRAAPLVTGENPVFSVEKGLIHVTGKQFGYLLTKQAFDHYYLRAEFKWGVGTYAGREGKARDSGILFNIPPDTEQKIWPRSLEFQINEGCTGDFWITDGAAITNKDGVRITGPENKATRIIRFGEGPWTNVTGFRDPVGEVENPWGEWNLLEMVNTGDHVKLYVNGKLVNEGSDLFPASGKLLLQSEGAEVYYRNVSIAPLK